MIIKEIEVYNFNELSDKSKECARDNFKKNYPHDNWYDDSIDYFKENSVEKGFIIDRVFFSGFWSQGDGAMFEYVLTDVLFYKFIDSLNLTSMRKNWLKNLTESHGRGKHKGHYHHSNSCEHYITWDPINDAWHFPNLKNWIYLWQDDFEKFVISEYKELCDQLYDNLEAEYEYLVANENIDEILEEEYEFFINGEIFTN